MNEVQNFKQTILTNSHIAVSTLAESFSIISTTVRVTATVDITDGFSHVTSADLLFIFTGEALLVHRCTVYTTCTSNK